MRLNMKTDLNPVNPIAHSVNQNPNMKIGALREALSQRRKSRVAKTHLISNNSVKPPDIDPNINPIDDMDI